MASRQSRIFLNDNIISHPSQRGISRYFRHVTDSVITRWDGQVVICSPERRNYGPAKYIPSMRFRGSWRLGFHDKWASIGAWVEHPTVMFSAYYGAASSAAMQVYTVYDMITELFPAYFSTQNPYVRRFIREKKLCLERAVALFAISSSVARDIVNYYPDLDKNKIFVTPLGVDECFFQVGKKDQETNKPFFLYVGNRTLHKNFSRLLDAFGRSGLAIDFDLRVISPVGDHFSSGETALINKYQVRDSIYLLTAVSDAELSKNYANAVAFVCPSEYEGFGLPILEAMASGTLVATSNTSSMPEIGGDVSFYFDPLNTESIADCLVRVAHTSSVERSERVERGIARARTFSWQRCQQQTVQVLKRLL